LIIKLSKQQKEIKMATAKQIKKIEKTGRIEILKRIGMINEYKKEFKKYISSDDIELNTFYVKVSY